MPLRSMLRLIQWLYCERYGAGSLASDLHGGHNGDLFFGIRGIEKASKFMMPMLFVLLLIIIARKCDASKRGGRA